VDFLAAHWSLVLLIGLALVFDFINGFHDAANSIATVVSTRVLSPRWAVAWAAFFNFIAFLFFGLHVAGTIGKGIVDIGVIDSRVIFATLIGACSWDLLTWWWGLPTSSSHALMGGLLGGHFHIPFWVVLACQGAIALGTMCGGWRIVKTMGQKVSKLRPVDGFCAETGAAVTLFFASTFGIPVSTTHTITGGIMGVGALRRLTAVRWGVAGDIVWAWVLTIPASAAVSAGTYWLVAR